MQKRLMFSLFGRSKPEYDNVNFNVSEKGVGVLSFRSKDVIENDQTNRIGKWKEETSHCKCK